MIKILPFSTRRKTPASARNYLKSKRFIQVTICPCYKREACLKPYKLRIRRTDPHILGANAWKYHFRDQIVRSPVQLQNYTYRNQTYTPLKPITDYSSRQAWGKMTCNNLRPLLDERGLLSVLLSLESHSSACSSFMWKPTSPTSCLHSLAPSRLQTSSLPESSILFRHCISPKRCLWRRQGFRVGRHWFLHIAGEAIGKIQRRWRFWLPLFCERVLDATFRHDHGEQSTAMLPACCNGAP